MLLFGWTTLWLLVAPSEAAFSFSKNSSDRRQRNRWELQHVRDEPRRDTDDDHTPLSRRTLLWKAPLGAVGVYAYGRLAYNALSVRGIQYPVDHENNVASTIATALTAAAAAKSARTATTTTTPFRILEVGVGTEARLIRRGLYDGAFHQLSGGGTTRVDRLELTGLDLQPPTDGKVINDATRKLNGLAGREGMDIQFTTVGTSISERTNFPDGYFDSIICCLTLCSVHDPITALEEMRRLLRPDGGTLGYVEHVAVEPDDGAHQFLAVQQQWLDPLQQLLADHCHLHRYTEQSIATVFQPDGDHCRYLQQERFYVQNMWPVSFQCCGVLQRI